MDGKRRLMVILERDEDSYYVATARSERVATYNRLLRIEEELVVGYNLRVASLCKGVEVRA